MTKIRMKPAVFDAVHWLGKYEEKMDWPDWFLEAEKSGVISFVGNSLHIKMFGNVQVVEPGSWVVPRHVGSFIHVISKEAFGKYFELVIEGE